MTQEEIVAINKHFQKPTILSFTADEAMRIKKNLNCVFCTGRKHTKETRCGKCNAIAAHLKNNKVVAPVLFNSC